MSIGEVEIYPSLNELINYAVDRFKNVYNQKPTISSYCPGRVNLIGDHVDYNDGCVLPMTIPLYTVVVGSYSSGKKSRIMTLAPNADLPKQIELDMENFEAGKPQWANYVKGVINQFPGNKKPFDAIIATSIPLGAGLSSSASLEVAFFNFLEGLIGPTFTISGKEKALMCQKAEQQYAGVPCGIMDQYVVILGKKYYAFLLDCRSLKYELIPFPNEELVILVINSNVHHNLILSKYAERRINCEQVSAMLAKSCLRDVSMKELETSRSVLQLDQYHFARHVITEIERTLSASEALKKKDFTVFGTLMTQSHYSLRDDFSVSCPEIDSLVEAALECEGVFGSRMTGGGFGGCTVTLVRKDKVKKVIEYIKSKSRINVQFYIFKSVDGANYETI